MWQAMTISGQLPSGATNVAAVIGDPVEHSLSPLILNAAFQAAEIDWVYTAFAVAPGDAAQALVAMRTLGLAGLSVTMPHKHAIAQAVDRCSGAAADLGAVNCVVWSADQLVGHSTDGAGLIDALRIDEGWDPARQRCAVIGAGGAARAAVLALAQNGASEVLVINRTAARATSAAALAGSVGRVAGPDEIDECALIVNATPIGMRASDAPVPLTDTPPHLPFAPERVGPGQLVLDMVYAPLMTPTVAAAAARGARATNGIGMLVHQAAHAFTLWTGEPAPLDAMSAAVIAELAISDATT